jgi:2-(1,2-epoxy-1,2-dihydrophenyl)acetyl-CoA isomerase
MSPAQHSVEEVSFELVGTVAFITMDREGAGNSLSRSLCGSTIAAIERAEAEATAIVLTGTGKFFSAGGDLGELQEWLSWDSSTREAYLERGPQALSLAITNSKLPVIAAVNGAAYGAGMDLALACDLRIAAASARFCEAYIKVGLTSGDGGAWLLPRHVGLGRAMELLLTARAVSAEEAVSIGLASRRVDDDKLLDEAFDLAITMGSWPREAFLQMRKIVLDSAPQSWTQHLDYARTVVADLAGTAEHRDAIERFSQRA